MYKTVNRGWLVKQIEKGNVEARCHYSLTDDYAFDNSVNFQTMQNFLPARIRRPKFEQYPDRNFIGERCVDGDHKEGFANFDEYDFRYKTGAAYRVEGSDNNEITLRVMSSEVWTLRLKK